MVFGVDRVNGVDEPEHNGATDRSTNLAGDDADLVVVITTPAAGTATDRWRTIAR